MKKKYILLILIIISSSALYSQSNMSKIKSLDKEYQTGNFHETKTELMKCRRLGFENNETRIEANRLLAKTYIALDQNDSAIIVIAETLKMDSKFEASPMLNDPPRLFEIIDSIQRITSKFTVTSISKKAENINEAPATAILINQDQINRRGYLDIEAMLYDLPGFDISRSNGNLYSHIYQRGYRSINTNRSLFLIDGIEDNDLWSSNVYLSRQYPLSNIKNVEVLYGPTSTMYGSNAFLGVINIVTKEPLDFIKPGKQVGVDVRSGYGSYNTMFFDGSFAVKTKDNALSMSVTARIFYSNEQDLSEYEEHNFAPAVFTNETSETYHALLDITSDSLVNVFLADNPSTHDFYSLNSDNQIILTEAGIRQAFDYDNAVYNEHVFNDKTEAYFIDTKIKIYDFLIGWTFWSKAEGTGSQYNDLIYMNYNQGASWRPVHNYLYVRYNKDIGKLSISNFLRYKIHDFHKDNAISIYNTRYAFNSYGLQDLINGVQPTWTNVYLFQKSNQIRNEFKTIYQLHEKIDIIAGFEARFSAIQGDYLSAITNDAEQIGTTKEPIDGGNNFYSRDLGVYAQTSIELLPTLKLTPGIRYDYNLVRDTLGYKHAFNPRAALVFTPAKFIFKLIYAEAFKDATNREKYSTAPGKRDLPNPSLQPEKVKNFEVAIGKTFGKNLFFNTALYYSKYSNIIQEVLTQMDNGEWTNQNQATGRAIIYGVNAFSNWEINNLSLYANYTYTEPYSLDSVENKTRISDISKHQVNFGANYLFRNVFNINLRTNIVGKRFTGENTTVPTNTEIFDPYMIFNGSLSYTPKKYGLTLQFTVFNILGTEYFSPGLDAATGTLVPKLVQNKRNMYISLIYKF